MSEPFVNARTVAKELSCHPRTIKRMAKLGEVPHIRVGRDYRFRISEVVKALRDEHLCRDPVNSSQRH